MIIRNNFSCFSLKLYIVTPDLNRLVEMVQMRGHNICFYAKLTKIIPGSDEGSQHMFLCKLTKIIPSLGKNETFSHMRR